MRKLAFVAILVTAVALSGCGASGSPHASRASVAASHPSPTPSPSPSSTHDVAVAWWNGSAHEALHRLRGPFQQFQQLAEEGKVDANVCQSLLKAGNDASSIAGSGIDALDSQWFPMAQHFAFLGGECQTAATVDLDSAWESMTNELQQATKDLLAFTGQLAKTLDVQSVDTA